MPPPLPRDLFQNAEIQPRPDFEDVTGDPVRGENWIRTQESSLGQASHRSVRHARAGDAAARRRRERSCEADDAELTMFAGANSEKCSTRLACHVGGGTKAAQ